MIYFQEKICIKFDENDILSQKCFKIASYYLLFLIKVAWFPKLEFLG